METPIRPFAPADGAALVHLSLLAFAPVFASFRQLLGPAIYAHLYPDWRARQRDVVEEVIADSANTTILVAELDGIVVGFIASTLDHQEKTGGIWLLAVHPDHQNRGIGTALNAAALAQMRANGMTLAVVNTGGDPGHAPARRTYEKAGYTALPQVRYYQHLVDTAAGTASDAAGGDAR